MKVEFKLAMPYVSGYLTSLRILSITTPFSH